MTPDIASVCRELVRRGWWVNAAEKTDTTLLIGFNFMPHAQPAWLKAFEVPHEEATPDGVERAIEAWKETVRHALRNGGASETVRRMVAEHGLARVQEAMATHEPV